MDFHTLTRKDLQALCKKNKIPANITNVAMADALKALETVDGLEEILNQSESNPSQESPLIPRTATRTSTRRKPTKEEPGSSQTLTRTRRTTRTITEELFQDNQDVSIPITPAVPTTRRRAPARRIMEAQVKESEEDEKLVVQEKGDVSNTPAVQGGRKRAPVPSSRRKMESQKEEGSVQRVYSTRRSVRLLEKNMAELSLKEKGRTEPVKMHVLDEVEEKKDEMAGSDLQTISDEVLEKTDDSEIFSVQNLNVLILEHKGEVKDDVQEINKSDDCEEKPEMGVSVLDMKDAYDGKTDESDVLLGENSETAIEMNDALIDGKEVTEDKDLEPVTEKDLNAIEDKGSEDFSAEVLDDVFAAESSLKQEIDKLMSVEEWVPNPLSLSSFGDQVNPENECQKLVNKQETNNMDVAEDDTHVKYDPELQFSTEEESDRNDEVSDENPSEEESDNHVNDDPELQFSTEEESDGNDEVSDENPFEEESDSDNDAEPGQQDLEDDVQLETEKKMKYDTESLVDVNVIEAEDFSVTAKSARQMGTFCPLVSDREVAANIPLPKIQELGNSDNLIDVYVIPEVEFVVTTHVHPPSLDKTPNSVKQQMSPCQPLLSGGKVTGGIPLSPLAAESLPGQFPRPTQSTPMKSSSKKQTTIQKLAQVSDINKENIDNGGGKVEPKKDKVKKNKKNNIDVDILDGTSLRKLTKMLKEKLQITNNSMNNEDKNLTKVPVEKTRPALQTLPENRMPAANGESEN